jgi:hypothetical protein
MDIAASDYLPAILGADAATASSLHSIVANTERHS